MRYLLYPVVVLCFILSAPSSAETRCIQQVEKFVAAFNAHDAEKMAEYVTADVQWLSVNGDKITIETQGKENLVKAMNGYFASCPSCQSELQDFTVLGSRVSVVEQASWRQNGEHRAQKSLAIYEFSEDLIRRVYYFPVD